LKKSIKPQVATDNRIDFEPKLCYSVVMMATSLNAARLILIPTPIHEGIPLESTALQVLKEASEDPNILILVEEHKEARIRWLSWGLPRESINRFILFNEHNQEESTPAILKELKNGKRAVIMSDGGLPAFCDPGQKLVRACHDHQLKVSATPFSNSISLAIALSGIPHHQFHFGGFLPARTEDRKKELESLHQRIHTPLILMDTPYRLHTLLKDLEQSGFRNRKVFLGLNLNAPDEQLYFGALLQVMKDCAETKKAEFILMIEGRH